MSNSDNLLVLFSLYTFSVKWPCLRGILYVQEVLINSYLNLLFKIGHGQTVDQKAESCIQTKLIKETTTRLPKNCLAITKFISTELFKTSIVKSEIIAFVLFLLINKSWILIVLSYNDRVSQNLSISQGFIYINSVFLFKISFTSRLDK